jgi:hypothetical protein
MAMPKGDSVQKVHDYYLYLQGHQLAPHGRTVTWHVAWVRDYRSSHPQTGISPLDRWGGYTTEAGARVPVFFWIVTLAIVAFGAEFVIGHLISGQVF